ncbi:MAG: hypothetical protein HPY66_0725 [Firmicutes bacterium]|nr:hypothetical protein [Bacillota bacterium]MDI6705658.1 hypothetical protein [Bacillota bacterium]
MKKKIIAILAVIVCVGLIGFAVFYSTYPGPMNKLHNEDVMEKYISDFLKNGYSRYYIINSIASEFRSIKTDEGKLEAIVFTTMNSNVPPKDPDTVPYIIEAKEKAQKETDPEKKKILQNEYETLKNKYGKPNDSNFVFMLTANLIDGKIDEKSIKLFLEQDTENNKVMYIPAEEILPK